MGYLTLCDALIVGVFDGVFPHVTIFFFGKSQMLRGGVEEWALLELSDI